MSTVILGGGIIGLSTAYYLAQSQSQSSTPTTPQPKIHIIDSSPTLLTSASGYAGGFLAKNWFSSASSPLGLLSFRLHRELADAHDGRRKWGYAPSTAYFLSIEERGANTKGARNGDEDWLMEGTSRSVVARGFGNKDGGKDDDNDWTGVGDSGDDVLHPDGTPKWITKQSGGTVDVISTEDGCAQVEPREFCEFLIGECERMGVQVSLGTKVRELVEGKDGTVQGLVVDKDGGKEEIQAKNIVITAGAWTPRVFSTLFPQSKLRIPIDPLAGHSIVVRSPRYTKTIVDPSRHDKNDDSMTGTCHAMFCAPGPNWSFAPEAISRIPKAGKPEVYVGGLNSTTLELPELASDAKALIDKQCMEELKKATVQLTGLSKEGDKLNVNDLEVVREGLCFRPAGRGGKPILTKVGEKDLGKGVKVAEDGGVFIAAGHGPWGISLSLGTGLVMKEMLLKEKLSADVRGLGLNSSSWF